MLTLSERLKVLGERVNYVTHAHGGIMLADLEHTYQLFQYGVIDPVQYECDSLIQLIGMLTDYVKVIFRLIFYLRKNSAVGGNGSLVSKAKDRALANLSFRFN